MDAAGPAEPVEPQHSPLTMDPVWSSVPGSPRRDSDQAPSAGMPSDTPQRRRDSDQTSSLVMPGETPLRRREEGARRITWTDMAAPGHTVGHVNSGASSSAGLQLSLGASPSSELSTLIAGQKQISEDIAKMSVEQHVVARAIMDLQKDVSDVLVSCAGGRTPRYDSMDLGSVDSAHVPEDTRVDVEGVFNPPLGSVLAERRDDRWQRLLKAKDVLVSTASDRERQSMLAVRSENDQPAFMRMDRSRSTTRDELRELCAGSTDVGPIMLDDRWPANIPIRRGLDELRSRSKSFNGGIKMPSEHGRSSNGRGTGSMGLRSAVSTGSFMHSEQSVKPRGGLQRFMVDPNSVQHMTFDIISMTVLIFDLTVIPYVLAWDMPFQGFLHWTAWGTCVFWTVDILLNFLTGVNLNGRLVMEPHTVARVYMRTWLLPDIGVAACDWISMVMITIVEDSTGSSGSLKILRFAKVGRLLRIVAMLRMMKFFRSIEEYIDTQLSESYKVALKIIMLSLGTLFLNHWISCAWIAVGRSGPSDTGFRWVETDWVMDGQRLEYLEADKMYQYITAFHWSVAQFTLGAIEISCNNTMERLFNIICLIVGLLFGSTLVSSLSATMVDFQMMKKDKTLKMRKLRQFLRENGVDRRMAVRVQQQAQERLGKKEELREKDVPALKLLSSQLRVELRFGIFQQHLLTHPLFRLWNTLDYTMMQRLCDETIIFLFLRPKDDLFVNGTKADSAYCLTSGTIHYFQDPESTGREEFSTMEVVPEGSWLCEAALWTDWVHVGRAEAATHVKAVSISSSGMLEAVKRHRRVRDVTVEYGRQFHRRIVACTERSTVLPTDIEVPLTGWEEMVSCLDIDAQVQIGLSALEQLGNEIEAGFSSLFRTAPRCLHQLRTEVLRGKSCVLVNAVGEVQRVVSVVVLRIQRETTEGVHTLVQLGKLEGGEIRPSCILPGGKQESGELPSETLTRLLSEKLHAFDGHVQVHKMTREAEWRSSKEYNLRTKYLRTVFLSSLTSKLEAKSLIAPQSLNKPCASGSVNTMSMMFQSERANTASSTGQLQRTSTHSVNVVGKPALSEKEVLVMPGEDGSQILYAWVLQEEFDHLAGATDELTAWLSALQHQLNVSAATAGVASTQLQPVPATAITPPPDHRAETPPMKL